MGSKIMLTSFFDRFLIDFSSQLGRPPKSSQILPKIDPKMHQIFDRFWHRFFVVFWKQLGAMLATFFAQNTTAEFEPREFFVGSMLFFDFLVSWAHFGSILECSGLHFGSFRVSILEVFGLHFG